MGNGVVKGPGPWVPFGQGRNGAESRVDIPSIWLYTDNRSGRFQKKEVIGAKILNGLREVRCNSVAVALL